MVAVVSRVQLNNLIVKKKRKKEKYTKYTENKTAVKQMETVLLRNLYKLLYLFSFFIIS